MKRRIFSVLSYLMIVLMVVLITHTLVVHLKNPGYSIYDIFEKYMLEYIIGISVLILFFIWGNTVK